MKIRLIIVCFLVLLSSCNMFETEKVSSEIFYDEELKAIDWKDVDRYPTFFACESFEEKEDLKTCFERTLSLHIYQSINSKNIVASREIDDSVEVQFSIDKTGMLVVTNIKMDSLVSAEFPLLNIWIGNGIDSIQPIAPAYKRGIPVETKFTLPISIKTQ